MDKRYELFRERLMSLSLDEICRIKDDIDVVCFDSFNYDPQTQKYCPLAIGMNLHNIIPSPTDEIIQEEISKRFVPANALKGIDGNFYTVNRRDDLLRLCDEVIIEKVGVSI